MRLTIFDCDGVLVDSELIALEILSAELRELGLSISPAECRESFLGKSPADVSVELEERLGYAPPDGFGLRVKKELFARLARELKPIRGVREVLENLPYSFCVASSSLPDRVALSLEVTGLAPLFQGRIFSASEVKHGKPAPVLFLHVASRMGVAPQEAIVVEDSPLGVIAARRAGMGVIGFAGGSHADDSFARLLKAAGAEEILTEMKDLPAAIERARSSADP